jgi:uncharacterized protein (DUF1778 family)
MKRRFTKVRKALTSVRLERGDKELIYRAALLRGISQSELVRSAVREFSERTLRDAAISR